MINTTTDKSTKAERRAKQRGATAGMLAERARIVHAVNTRLLRNTGTVRDALGDVLGDIQGPLSGAPKKGRV